MIVTANHWFGNHPLKPAPTWEAYLRGHMLLAMLRHGVQLGPGVSDTEPLPAFVNHGFWLVRCECGGAEKVWEEGLMICASCWNGEFSHQLRRTTFPEYRQQIESLLVPRPLQNRNWFPGETIDNLQRENLEHGIEVE